LVLGFQVFGMVWSWELCVRFAGCCSSICSCSTAVYKPVWRIPLLSVEWINSWWWTDELSETCRVSWQNKFVILVHLVGFIHIACMGVKLGRWHWGTNVGWGCLRIGCWGEYLGLRGMR
jgi:hypothetical protein